MDLADEIDSFKLHYRINSTLITDQVEHTFPFPRNNARKECRKKFNEQLKQE